MAKYLIDESTLTGLANAIRKVNGETRTYTPSEMIEAVTNIMDSVTYILTDKDGNEVQAVFVDAETVFDATANDIRIGTTAVTDSGVTVGEKVIPSYHTQQGVRVIPVGSSLTLLNTDEAIDSYDYTKMQAIICSFNSSLTDSVSTQQVSIDDNVYDVQSVVSLSSVTKNHTSKTIELGISNNTESPLIIRYFMYKEIK